MNFQVFNLDLENAEEPEIKLPTCVGSSKKAREFQENIYFCFIDYAKAFDCVHHNKLWKILKECNITRRGKKKKKNTTECSPNCNFQWRSSPGAHVHHQ